MKKILTGLIMLIILNSLSCGLKNETVDLVNNYYKALSSGEDTLGYFSPSFFSETPKNQWLEMRSYIEKELGKCKSWKLKKWNISTSTNKGTQGNLQYKVTYERGESIENIILIKENEEFLIHGFHIKSNALKE